MSIDEEPHGSVLSYPTFTELSDILSLKFEIVASALEYGIPTFVAKWPAGIVPDDAEQELVFQEITEASDRLRVWPVVRWRDKTQGEYLIRFIPEQKAGKSDIRINYALFVATIATIALGGFLQATSPIFMTLFYPMGMTVFDLAYVTITFILSLMGIIFTHEMGHYLTSKKKGIEASPPYFIPGLPQLGGTFGAFIQQKSPPMNRKDLFDLGVAGPLAGFAVTLVVLVIGFLMSAPVTAEELAAIEVAYPGMSGEIAVPPLFIIMEMIWVDFIPPGGTLYLHPIAFAAWVGMLVTALNLFPIGQLDGGHALRAIVDPTKHKYIGWIAIAVMVLAGYYLMAILVLVLSSGRGHPGALNDTVNISKWRIALFVVAMIVLYLCLPPLWQMMF